MAVSVKISLKQQKPLLKLRANVTIYTFIATCIVCFCALPGSASLLERELDRDLLALSAQCLHLALELSQLLLLHIRPGLRVGGAKVDASSAPRLAVACTIMGTGVFVSLALAAGVGGALVLPALLLAALLATCNGLSSAQLAAARRPRSMLTTPSA